MEDDVWPFTLQIHFNDINVAIKIRKELMNLHGKVMS